MHYENHSKLNYFAIVSIHNLIAVGTANIVAIAIHTVPIASMIIVHFENFYQRVRYRVRIKNFFSRKKDRKKSENECNRV